MVTIASIWDPLGLICPVVTKCKILLQSLWLAKIDWDDKLPSEVHSQWSQIVVELVHISSISIPRAVMPYMSCKYQIIGFADASELAYGAYILYISDVNLTLIQCVLIYFVLNRRWHQSRRCQFLG